MSSNAEDCDCGSCVYGTTDWTVPGTEIETVYETIPSPSLSLAPSLFLSLSLSLSLSSLVPPTPISNYKIVFFPKSPFFPHTLSLSLPFYFLLPSYISSFSLYFI
uniref:Uncharacterized protein n=1 Tax=Cacopsylla melanoneura TaxID=428564 RepID=A0A8D8THH1_9HEMI